MTVAAFTVSGSRRNRVSAILQRRKLRLRAGTQSARGPRSQARPSEGQTPSLGQGSAAPVCTGAGRTTPPRNTISHLPAGGAGPFGLCLRGEVGPSSGERAWKGFPSRRAEVRGPSAGSALQGPEGHLDGWRVVPLAASVTGEETGRTPAGRRPRVSAGEARTRLGWGHSAGALPVAPGVG